MRSILPARLTFGDTIGVIAPSQPLTIISEETIKIANSNFKKLGLNVKFADNLYHIERYTKDSIDLRVSDIHKMFCDKKIKGIFTAIGGYSAEQLIRHLNYDLIKNNPKIFCGYSNTTVISNAIFAKTGLITYVGPHYSTFGQSKGLSYIFNDIVKCFFESNKYEIKNSKFWSDDLWWLNQNSRNFIKNTGPNIVNSGYAKGIAIGGNLNSFLSLSDSIYAPDLKNKVLFLEVTELHDLDKFDFIFEGLLMKKNFKFVKAVLIGRFQKNSLITTDLLTKLLLSKRELSKIPVVINMDFGHTQPLFTIPIGGEVEIDARNKMILRILSH